MMKKIATLCLFIALLNGCVHYEEHILSPKQTFQEFTTRSFEHPGLKAFLQQNHLVQDWPPDVWTFSMLTGISFYFHPDMDKAQVQWDLARAKLKTAGEYPNPSLELTPGYDTTFDPTLSPWTPGLTLNFLIETAGKRDLRMAKAKCLVEAAKLQYASIAWQVRSRLHHSLLHYYVSNEAKKLLEKQKAIQTELVQLMEVQWRSGEISPTELTRERISLNTTILSLYDADRELAEATVQLADALGMPKSALEGVVISWDEFQNTLEGLDEQEMREEAAFNRTDLLSALAEYAASQIDLQLEVANQYPDIQVGPGYEFDQGDNKWSIGLSLTLPIFSQNQGAIAEAQARRRQAAVQFVALQTKVIGEIERTIDSYRYALDKFHAAKTLLEELRKQGVTSQAMYKAGEISRLGFISTQREINEGELTLLKTMGEKQEMAIQLEDAMQHPLDPTASSWLVPALDRTLPKGAEQS